MASQTSRDEAVAAFAEIATAEEKAKAAEVDEAVQSVVTAALQIDVRNAAEAEHATEFLTRLAGEKRRSESARRFLVDPLNAHVKAINARFKPNAEALEQANGIVREKVLTYRQEQERLRREEQARLEAERLERERQAEEERRRQEAEARAERERAAREAAAAEAAAQEAQRRRAEQLAQAETEMEAKVRALPDDELRAIVRAGEEPDRARVAARELVARRDAREAQERAAAARQREEEERAREQALRDAPLPELPRTEVAPSQRLESASGSISERKVWKHAVVDEARVPREYLVVDEKKIRAAVKAGVREIAGVRIEQVDELAVRAR